MGAIRDGKARWKWAIVAGLPLLAVGILQTQASAGPSDQAAEGAVVISQTKKEAAAAEGYWTEKRMKEAQPADNGYVVDQEDLGASAEASPTGPPGFVPGSPPTEAAKSQAQAVQSDALIGEPQHGTKPTNPLSGPYGPFQRLTQRGRFTAWPASTIGKLFTTGIGTCSASTIAPNKIITAGHCISNGAGGFGSNFTFCPAWNQGGTNPAFGCWDNWVQGATSSPWHNNGDPDYDYAVITYGNDGVCNCLPGSAVGWNGYGWNWGTNQPDMAFGYPVAAPFNGNLQIQVASTDWYTHDFVGGGQISKVMGNDMTPGSSGGPWILGWRHVNTEIADTDNSNSTDPAGPFVNGVNSHKRCVVSCQSPPTSTNGVFWQEMTSPPFEDTADPADVVAIINTI